MGRITLQGSKQQRWWKRGNREQDKRKEER